MVSRTVGDSKPKRKISKAEKDRRARQAASLRKTLSTREARARMSAASKRSWTPERRTRQGATLQKTWTDKGVRSRRIKGIKKAWTLERREAQRAATKKIMADPEQNARRLAGLRRSSSDPELKALRIANLKKALADPTVNRRRINKMKQTLYRPEINASRSKRLKKMWADFRAGRAAMTEIEKAQNRRRGRPRMDERYKAAAILRERGWSWRDIARKYDPDFAKDQEAAMHRMRVGVERVRQSQNQETPR